MSNTTVSYAYADGVATITLDDGKLNALSPDVLKSLDEAVTKAEAADAIIVLTGREGVFSAGFDLKVMKRGAGPAFTMLNRGFALAERLFAYPRPVIVASSGHAIAMGLFLVLAADYTIGAEGEFKYVANEVAIGLTLPRCVMELCRNRISPAAYNRAAILSEAFAPESACRVGILDNVVPAELLLETAYSKAEEVAKLDAKAHAETKLRVRAKSLRRIAVGRKQDMLDVARMGIESMIAARMSK